MFGICPDFQKVRRTKYIEVCLGRVAPNKPLSPGIAGIPDRIDHFTVVAQ